MREKTVEAKLVAAVKAMGGLSPKFISPGYDGMPDRLVLLPNGILAFVELKAPGKKLRPLQVRRKAQVGRTRLFGVLHRQAGADRRCPQ